MKMRAGSHLRTKEFWTRVVFFTSKDDNITKAHVKYLEARLVELARVPHDTKDLPKLQQISRIKN
jgi:hypothetical protein